MGIRTAQFICLLGAVFMFACSSLAQQDSTRLEDLLKKDIFKRKQTPTTQPKQTLPPKSAGDATKDDSLLPPEKSGQPEKTDKRDFDAKADSSDIPSIPKVPDIPEMPNANVKPANASAKRIALKRDVLSRHMVPITMSRKDRVQKRHVPLNMLPENAAVTGRLGKITKASDGWYVVEYVESPDLKPLARQRLLPCRNLESVIEILKKEPGTVFGIYGQSMTFNNTPYLLLRRVTLPDNSKENRTLLDLETEKKARDDAVESESDKPAYEGEETGEIIADLLEENRGAGVKTSFAPKPSASENVESVAPAGKAPLSRGRDNLVIDRITRIIKPADSKWYQARFESDNTLREPPYRVLPNSKLQEAVRINQKLGRSSTKYRISGEITYFQGKRYLLITKIFLQRDMRQF